MNRLALGFWVMVVAALLRATRAVPALVAQRPGMLLPLSVAAIVFACYIATAVLTVRRVRAAGPGSAANLIWAMGGAGLALAVAILMLV
jgi:hypothetical protein